ncbi:MAG: pyridoxal-phosphate dependent enzyme [Candidatus Pacebacteria bacterium]|nr:pyridoxal-phosphate dependent enzyme [Candidatus Paceibacterota bacterium]
MLQEVYASPSDFFNPLLRQATPLVNVTETLNLFPAEEHVSFWVKVMTVPPIYSIKWFMTYQMLHNAYTRSELDGIEVIVVASSGNTAAAVGLAARFYGIKYIVAIVPADIPQPKAQQLEFNGVHVIKHQEAPGDTCIDRAARLGRRKGWFNFRQYEDPGNWKGQALIGSQIWAQTEGLVTVAGVGMGTIGTARGLRLSLPGTVHVVGGKLKENNPVPGLRPESKLQPNFDRTGINEVEVEKEESYAMGAALRGGALAFGPSTGAGAVAVARYVRHKLETGTDGEIRNRDGEICCVFIGCDLANLYIERYTGALPSGYFSANVPGLLDE